RRERIAHLRTEKQLTASRREANRLERALSRAQTYYDTQTSLSADAIAILDVNQQVLEINAAARSIFGEPSPQASLISWTQNHQLAEIINRTLNRQLDITHQFEYRRRVFQVKAAALKDNDQLLGAILILKDVSELQRLGRARRELVANISHDLRTPIAGIRLVAETLLNGALKEPEMAAHLTQKIIDEADTLEQINQELMDLSLIESGRMPLKLVSLNLTKRIKKEIKRFKNQAARKDLEFILDIPGKIRALADKGMLSRVLGNLIHNAIKFTERGRITISAAAEGDMVRVTVADTGPGIAPKDQARIFERFYIIDTARSAESEEAGKTIKTGTGLGLAIVKHIVQAHGGEVGVNSQLGQGAIFWFTLPAADT
ncbi:MAG TPA: hypothetical protein ENK24_04450, partial [Anaerolineae bacterium]|nr:hypothetical protein [Anaerolineae bacterium]